MSNVAELSGAFQRPNLIDYLLVAEHQQLAVGLHVHVGRLDIGIVGVHAGQPIHADMPGASGNTAFSLLARVSNARIVPSRWQHDVGNIDKPWRDLVSEDEPALATGRSQRLAQVRAELRELDSEGAEGSGVFERVEPERDHEYHLAARVAAEIVDWAVVESYLRGEFEHARGLIVHRERLCPGELLPAANLERLRLRLLEDEFVAGVAEVKE
jgi:hypothetical protein